MNLLHALLIAFGLFSGDAGPPEAAFHARVYDTITKMCPATSPARLARYARVIARAALERDDPEATAEALLGIGAHETCFTVERQRGGPAVGAWQVEVHVPGDRPDAEWERWTETEMLVADPHAAARAALRVLDACHGDLRCYATGSSRGGRTARGNAVTAQLAACVAVAGKGMRQENGVGPCRAWYKEPVKQHRKHKRGR